MYDSDLTHHNATLHKKLEGLYALSRGKRLVPGFRDVYVDLLHALDNPHERLPPTIHVAGTNGKGSTIAFMKAILQRAGYSVHTYTSPHLMTFNERIVLNGEIIDDSALERLIDRALAANNGGDVTFFEITTAMAFDAFANTPADALLLETGLGGRLDCTNIIPRAEACVITPISFDHTEFLGETLTAIAAEKAGIIKNNTPCISSNQHDEALNVLQKTAAEKNAPFIIVDDEQDYNAPGLKGDHQIENARTAITALRSVPRFRDITDAHIQTGLQTVSWPGRLQDVTEYFDMPDDRTIIYDGGHNIAAAESLAQFIKQSKTNTHIIIGMMQGKNVQAFLDRLMPHVQSVTAVTIPDEPMAMTARDIADYDETIKTAESLRDAVRSAGIQTKDTSRILICGSFYLARHIMSR